MSTPAIRNALHATRCVPATRVMFRVESVADYLALCMTADGVDSNTLGEAMGTTGQAVRQWRARGRVPERYWQRLDDILPTFSATAARQVQP